MSNPFFNRSQLAMHHAVSVGQTAPVVVQRTVVVPGEQARAAIGAYARRAVASPTQPIQTAQRVAMSGYLYLPT